MNAIKPYWTYSPCNGINGGWAYCPNDGTVREVCEVARGEWLAGKIRQIDGATLKASVHATLHDAMLYAESY